MDTAPQQTPEHGTLSLKERAREELLSYAMVSAYLFVCFSALVFYKAALLREDGLAFLPHGIAAIKALILGKFVLIGRAAGVGTRARGRSLLATIAIEVLLFFVLLVVLSVLEELLVGLAHGHSFSQTLGEYREHTVLVMLANCWLLLLVLVPLIAVAEISAAMGPGVLRHLLVSRRE